LLRWCFAAQVNADLGVFSAEKVIWTSKKAQEKASIWAGYAQGEDDGS
jgi:hypothetical protein